MGLGEIDTLSSEAAWTRRKRRLEDEGFVDLRALAGGRRLDDLVNRVHKESPQELKTLQFNGRVSHFASQAAAARIVFGERAIRAFRLMGPRIHEEKGLKNALVEAGVVQQFNRRQHLIEVISKYNVAGRKIGLDDVLVSWAAPRTRKYALSREAAELFGIEGDRHVEEGLWPPQRQMLDLLRRHRTATMNEVVAHLGLREAGGYRSTYAHNVVQMHIRTANGISERLAGKPLFEVVQPRGVRKSRKFLKLAAWAGPEPPEQLKDRVRGTALAVAELVGQTPGITRREAAAQLKLSHRRVREVVEELLRQRIDGVPVLVMVQPHPNRPGKLLMHPKLADRHGYPAVDQPDTALLPEKMRDAIAKYKRAPSREQIKALGYFEGRRVRSAFAVRDRARKSLNTGGSREVELLTEWLWRHSSARIRSLLTQEMGANVSAAESYSKFLSAAKEIKARLQRQQSDPGATEAQKREFAAQLRKLTATFRSLR